MLHDLHFTNSIISIFLRILYAFIQKGNCSIPISSWGSVKYFLFWFSLLSFNRLLTSYVMFFFSFLSRNTPTRMTCSWGERRSCLELRESTTLRCWLTGPTITRLVRVESVEMALIKRHLHIISVSLYWWQVWITTPGNVLDRCFS